MASKRLKIANGWHSNCGPIFVHDDRLFETVRELLGRWEAKPPSELTRGMIIGTVDIIDVLPLDEYLRKFYNQKQQRGKALK